MRMEAASNRRWMTASIARARHCAADQQQSPLGACPFSHFGRPRREYYSPKSGRSLPFGVDTSIGAVETHASENLILHDSEICDYSDRLIGDELLKVARREVLTSDQHHRLLGEQCDRCEIGSGVVGKLLI